MMAYENAENGVTQNCRNQNLSLTPNCRKEKSLLRKNVENLILNVWKIFSLKFNNKVM